MTLPIPSGTRDVLPDEMRERHGVVAALRDVFTSHGYGEVSTPAVEYASVLDRAGVAASAGAADPRFRSVDEHGETLVLRSDMTVPIARLVSSRFADAELPIRLSYQAHLYRGIVPGRGQSREVLQAGIELVGAGAPEGTAEALTVLVGALKAVGLEDARVAVGDASIFPTLLAGAGVEDDRRAAILHELATRDLVGLEREVRAACDDATAAMLLDVASRRGGLEVVDALTDPRAVAATAGVRSVVEQLDEDVRSHLILDLGLTLKLGYYTGAVFEVYAPGQGHAIGGGGRYDDLLGKFGRDLPAVGFALDVDALHTALVGKSRGSWRVGWTTPTAIPSPEPVAAPTGGHAPIPGGGPTVHAPIAGGSKGSGPSSTEVSS
ncbi:ATP phosphoribosyltransferase regulatory subunit [Patulibacter minatonensis]|uniref:ATP phosphoribosyltransferase regulatory subunit n=1 Tax=Patulibacter minatonensis TaxID=298163 RepID=UPI000A007C32|nr:ATP phosphoribosyltransferase regulatory subunit [Patulibacter minatonensis]